jgi:hypothetical protein
MSTTTTPRPSKPAGVCRCGGAWISPPHVPRGLWFCGACGAEYAEGLTRVISAACLRIMGGIVE